MTYPNVVTLMEPATCLFCRETIYDKRQESGAKNVDWATEDGDFGCNTNPITGEDGTGPHAAITDQWLKDAQLREGLAFELPK